MNYTFIPDPKRLASINKEVEELYYKKYKEALVDEINTLFHQSRTIDGGRVVRHEGPLRTLVKEQVENFYLSEKTQDRAIKYIDDIFIPVIDDCIKDAVKHVVRRENFSNIVQRTKDTLSK